MATKQKIRIRQFQDADRRRRNGDATIETNQTPPLVRVAVRAGEPKKIWKPVWEFIFRHQKMLIQELDINESFIDRHSKEPCHGFLILCDKKTRSGSPLDPRQALTQCREIQMQQKREGQSVCPVAVVFQSPPDPDWSDLIRSTPLCLSEVLGNDLEKGLEDFLEQVRRAVS